MIFKSDFWMLGLAGSALALSMVVDTVFHSLAPQLVYLEDSAKFFGIFCWASFHVTAMAEHLSPAARRA